MANQIIRFNSNQKCGVILKNNPDGTFLCRMQIDKVAFVITNYSHEDFEIIDPETYDDGMCGCGRDIINTLQAI